jgi:hypothetical protein
MSVAADRRTRGARGPEPGMMDPVPLLPRFLIRRLGPVGVALTIYDLWRHLPAKKRKQLVNQGRTHGTRAARFVIKQGAAQIRKRRG